MAVRCCTIHRGTKQLGAGLMLDRSVARGKVLILNPDFELIRPNPRGSSARCKPLIRYFCDKISIVKSTREREREREEGLVVILLIPYEI